MRILRDKLDMEGEGLDLTMESLFAIFYVDDAYIAEPRGTPTSSSRQSTFLSHPSNALA